jgi:hypothetical protein
MDDPLQRQVETSAKALRIIRQKPYTITTSHSPELETLLELVMEEVRTPPSGTSTQSSKEGFLIFIRK